MFLFLLTKNICSDNIILQTFVRGGNMKTKRKFKIVDRRKFNRFIIVSILLLTIFIYGIMALMTKNKVKSMEIKNEDYIIVYSGDTLWHIAQKSSRKEEDLRKVVYGIKKANGLRSSNIYPGQVLFIPNN